MYVELCVIFYSAGMVRKSGAARDTEFRCISLTRGYRGNARTCTRRYVHILRRDSSVACNNVNQAESKLLLHFFSYILYIHTYLEPIYISSADAFHDSEIDPYGRRINAKMPTTICGGCT